MGSSFLITLREGLEASLVISILLTYLAKTNRRDETRSVWLGTIAATVACLVVGIAVYVLVDGLNGNVEYAVEGTLALAAMLVLTQMIFWMRANARNMTADLRKKVETSSKTALVTIAFVVSVAIGVAIFRAGSRVNLKTFFNVTAVLLLMFAAGLAGKTVHEFRELLGLETGYLIESAWTIESGIWSAGGTFYDFMRGLFGWHANPERVRVIAYFAYLIPVLAIYLKRPKAEKQLVS
jgi:high-affinity iron transporter